MSVITYLHNRSKILEPIPKAVRQCVSLCQREKKSSKTEGNNAEESMISTQEATQLRFRSVRSLEKGLWKGFKDGLFISYKFVKHSIQLLLQKKKET